MMQPYSRYVNYLAATDLTGVFNATKAIQKLKRFRRPYPMQECIKNIPHANLMGRIFRLDPRIVRVGISQHGGNGCGAGPCMLYMWEVEHTLLTLSNIGRGGE